MCSSDLSLCWMLRSLNAIADLAALGEPVERVLGRPQFGAQRRRAKSVQSAIQRLGRDGLQALLLDAAEVDATVKGRGQQEPWPALSRLCLALAGAGKGLSS